ncbi:MAG: complex I NDUFA9 subunit family protein [Gammaproteobacteria bacterium]
MSPLCTVFGGSGFLGRHVVAALAGSSWQVRVAVRHPRAVPGFDAEVVGADVRDGESVAAALAGASAVVNAVGLWDERGDASFEAVHVRGAERVARFAAQAGVERLVHVSGIGAEAASPSRYVRARAAGEARVRARFADATIVRPSVMFGPGDALLTTLDRLSARSPVVPLFGHGETRLAPVFVDDVARAIAAALEDDAARGQTFELGGPEAMSYATLVRRVLEFRCRRRALVPVPFEAWAAAARIAARLPRAPLTPDQVALMRHDNLPDPARDGFAALGLVPRSLGGLLGLSLLP